MPDLATILERQSLRVDPRPQGLDRLRRRRDRRQRNRRIGAATLALAITAAAIGYTYAIFVRQDQPLPMDHITSGNVGLLGLAWSAEDVHPGGAGTPTVADGRVFIDQGSGTIRSYSVSCPGSPEPCAAGAYPASQMTTSHNGFVVGRHEVYASWSGGGSAFAAATMHRNVIDVFDRSCATAECSVRWRSISNFHRGGISAIAEVGHRMYALMGDDTLAAFAPSCGHVVCQPAWTARAVSVPSSTGDEMIVRGAHGVAAYASRCWEARGPSCRAIWSGAVTRLDVSSGLPPTPVIADDHVVAADPTGIVTFPLDCSGVCVPEWRASLPGGSAFEPVASGGSVFAVAADTADLFTFPIGCDALDGVCDPTWVGHPSTGAGFAPVVGDGYVFTASELDRTLTAFPVTCVRDCAPAWTAQLEGGILFPPEVSGDLVYVSDLEGVSALDVRCEDPCTPTFRWDLPGVTWTPQSAPVIAGDSLLVVGGNRLFTLRLGAGTAATAARGEADRISWLILFGIGVAGVTVMVARARRRRMFP
jgi:hypothetical protein